MIIGICGKSGSGKSTFAKQISELYPNTIHVDIDKIGHLSHEDEEIKNKLVDTFGENVLVDGKVDRKYLGKKVFNNEQAMNLLSDITWSFMENKIDEIINLNKDKIIILDWLLLPKTKYLKKCKLKILVDTPYEIRLERCLKRDNITEKDFELRESSSIQYEIEDFDIVIGKEKTDLRKLVLSYE